ncbi:right-handed parallel beta-helix repeat-containing protein [Paenibacillus taichungensis]
MGNIDYTTVYSNIMPELDTNNGYNASQINAMFGQVIGNIEAVKSTLSGKVIQVKNYAPGDGSDQTVGITEFFNKAENGDTLYFTPGVYKVTKDGVFYNFVNKRITIKALPGAILEVSDMGLRFENCDYVHVDGLTIQRATQAGWSKNKYGMHAQNCSNVLFENNDVSRFTDGISADGSKDLTNPCRNVVIRRNRIHDLGEEPIAVRTGLRYVIVTENECYRHLGDGILIKATRELIITKNFIHSAIKHTDADFLTYSANNPAGGNDGLVPYIGGGITCNNEGGEDGAKGVYIHNNMLSDIGYGLGMIGFRGVFITSNRIEKIHRTSAISVSFLPSVYNPAKVTNHVFLIDGNHIENILRTDSTAAIEARTKDFGTEGLDTGVISNNIIIPNGNHTGIHAEGNIAVHSNYLAECGFGMILKNGVVATGNIIRPIFASAPQDRMVEIWSDVTFSNNSVTGRGNMVKLRGSNCIIQGNRFSYTGSWYALHFDTDYAVEGNLIRDNILKLGPNAQGKYVYGSSTTSNGKNIVVDLYKDNNGLYYQLTNEVVLKGASSTRWKLILDATGNITTTQL